MVAQFSVAHFRPAGNLIARRPPVGNWTGLIIGRLSFEVTQIGQPLLPTVPDRSSMLRPKWPASAEIASLLRSARSIGEIGCDPRHGAEFAPLGGRHFEIPALV